MNDKSGQAPEKDSANVRHGAPPDDRPVFACSVCGDTEKVQLSYPVHMLANDPDNSDGWEVDEEAEPLYGGEGYCPTCDESLPIERETTNIDIPKKP